MKLHCAIVDDEPLALSLLESYVNKTPFLELAGKYSSAVQAMKELPGHQIDLLFLDIQMPELNGLEFSKMVDARTRIVFTTAFGQYAIDGYRVNALDYLLQAHLVCRLPAGGQQGIAVVRTRSETRGNRQYFREERLQTGTGRAQKDIVHRRSEGLYQNLYRRCSQAHPITYEYEVHGRAASPHPLYTCTPLFHCPKGQNTHHRPRPHRIR